MKRIIVPILAGMAACVLGASAGPVFQLRLADEKPSDGAETMTYVTQFTEWPVTNTLYVQKAVLIDETGLKSAWAGKDALGHSIVDIRFNKAGTKHFAEVTRQNMGKRLAIIIDGQVMEAPMVRSEITSGEAQITGSFDQQQAKDLAKKINEAAKGK